MTARKPRKPRTLEDVIRDATRRGLARMELKDGFIDGHWTGKALASWVSPVVFRAVERHLARRTEGDAMTPRKPRMER